MKRCFKCGVEKPLSEFYVHKAMTDGHFGKCKDCTRKDVARNYRENHEYYLEYEKSRLDDPSRKEARKQYSRWLRRHHPERVKRTKAKYSKSQRAASGRVNYAVRAGHMEKGACAVCGSPKTEGHHEDYNSPLDVIWLCRTHHGYVHRFSGEDRRRVIESIKNRTFSMGKAS